ncbi:Putative protein in type-1 retrotransposable element R1DM, partial [Araneus ventricosus]
CLRKAKIFFLQKPGKDPKSCDAYRPVCLLPTIGKILERVFRNRFNKYFSLNDIIHRNQNGFREGTGCDKALDNIVNKIREIRSNQHCAMISLDIKSAFDNMDWSVLFKIFDFYKSPLFYRNFIYYYLLDRKVVFKDETLEIERDCHKGCPQGSVVALNLWNIYVNRVLEINSEKVFLQAFADDFAFVTAGSVRKELEININEALGLIQLTLVELKLELSVGKCWGLAFRSLVRHQKRKGQNIFNRKPVFKINGQSIRIGESLKYLGVLLHSRLTWSSHILSLHAKVYSLTNNFSRIIKTNWNLDKELVKIWYLTAIEKALLYSAGIWGGALTCEQIKRLHMIQRVFLIKLLRPYRTTATQALNVLSGIPPLHLTVKMEYLRFQIWTCRLRGHDGVIDLFKLDKF